MLLPRFDDGNPGTSISIRLDLLPGERFASLASDRLERYDIALTKTGDRTVDGSRSRVACGALQPLPGIL